MFYNLEIQFNVSETFFAEIFFSGVRVIEIIQVCHKLNSPFELLTAQSVASLNRILAAVKGR